MAGCGEFDLIRQYLTGLGADRGDVTYGVGDDAAITCPPASMPAVLALDTLVAGVHFPQDLPAAAVGYRALAVNLTDMAAMGATPAWALLGLTLPASDADWVAAFAGGLDRLARLNNVAVVGGDITRGPLTISLQITGFSPAPLRRDGARPGDRVWVSGRPGDAAGGLEVWQSAHRQTPRWQGLVRAFTEPRPRIALGQALRGIASAVIDVSDGVLADAGHIAEASQVALQLESTALQPSARLRAWAGAAAGQDLTLAGGDDYELLFTAPDEAGPVIGQVAGQTRTPVRCIGRVVRGAGVDWGGQNADAAARGGYRHFD
ncbi:thiamine-phosphate kinase [Spiribacter sp. 218]|uniref:thiamine-phosphate kinase n=1 Tax=Spiribacter pallidus TaxID=1987936 RepID=UPI00349F2A88